MIAQWLIVAHGWSMDLRWYGIVMEVGGQGSEIMEMTESWCLRFSVAFRFPLYWFCPCLGVLVVIREWCRGWGLILSWLWRLHFLSERSFEGVCYTCSVFSPPISLVLFWGISSVVDAIVFGFLSFWLWCLVVCF